MVRISALKAGSELSRSRTLVSEGSSFASSESRRTATGRNTGSLHRRSGGWGGGPPNGSAGRESYAAVICLAYRRNRCSALDWGPDRPQNPMACPTQFGYNLYLDRGDCLVRLR